MQEGDFTSLLRSLNEYYGLDKIISPGRARQWFAKCADIPAEAVAYIRTGIENSSDSLPRNLPKAIRAHYNLWRNENANKLQHQATTCPECCGRGFFHVRRQAVIDGTPATHADGRRMVEEVTYRCAACQNWQPHVHPEAMPSTTRRDLLERGYDLIYTGEPKNP